jgi:sec-independent protein translocase protein TatC
MQVGTPIITIKDYMSMVMVLIFGFGMIFETPVILILLAMLDIISADQLAEHRRVILIAILVVAALLTPPDPISQLAMAVPVFVMYEASIIIIRLIKKKPNENLPAT